MSGGYVRTTDLFTLPDGDGNHVLYAPRQGFIGLVNPDLVNLLARVESSGDLRLNDRERACLEELERRGLLNGKEPGSPVPAPPGRFEPRQVTLFPTNRCNLRCRYCYAEAGDAADSDMPWPIAEAAVDLVRENVKKAGGRRVSVGFHGGGEPLLRQAFVREVVDHVRRTCQAESLEPTFSAATNGILPEPYLDWIVERFSGLSISYDGLPDVQNEHRPLPDGEGSHERVERTFRRLDEAGFAYSIRATVSSRNVNRMVESLEHIHGQFHPQTVSFEPLHFCGRCSTGDLEPPDLEHFGRRFSECRDWARARGAKVEYSGCRLGKLSHSFCGVTRDNFAVTPEGFITTCYEVLEAADPRSDTFFIGRIDLEGKLSVREPARRRLHDLTVDNIAYCEDCFAKWNCSGDCLAKVENNDYGGDRGHGRCRLNRAVLARELRAVIRQRAAAPRDPDDAARRPSSGGPS